MSFCVIKGTFHVKGYEPDGDSVKFMAKNVNNWSKLSGPKVKFASETKFAQLRIEAIDALETHYVGYHQPCSCAIKERTYLLKKLKIKDIEWNEKETRVIDAHDGTSGYILSSKVERYKRPVAFVFTGDPEKEDGSQIYLDRKLAKKSINYKMIKEGLAYPTYYENFAPDLRDEFNKAVKSARKDKKGIWKYDKTNSGVNIATDEAVTRKDIILPKLFRRIVTHLKKNGKPGDFKEFLEDKEDKVKTSDDEDWFDLVDIVDIDGNVVKLKEKPENLIFKEM